ncbi:hypothetical protein PIB30_081988 [Stylosanthes scabra]|uniref:Aminotransferase-like plant mobile domain-containing protein n=1 Tax=Stylosanthes scabra TaxID=79078 RepID=A0ABU6QSQ9_9FABA|nr:hypothetical protein [Stylosanthes scabra]
MSWVSIAGGSATLAWLYKILCRASSRKVVQLARPLALLKSWIFWRFPSLCPHGFDDIRWPLAARWGGFLPSSDEKAPRVLQLRHRLDMLRESDFVWVSYSALNVVGMVDLAILEENHMHVWRPVTAMIYFGVIEWHHIDQVETSSRLIHL